MITKNISTALLAFLIVVLPVTTLAEQQSQEHCTLNKVRPSEVQEQIAVLKQIQQTQIDTLRVLMQIQESLNTKGAK